MKRFHWYQWARYILRCTSRCSSTSYINCGVDFHHFNLIDKQDHHYPYNHFFNYFVALDYDVYHILFFSYLDLDS